MNDPVFLNNNNNNNNNNINKIRYNNNKAMGTFHTYIQRVLKGGFLS